MPLLPEHAPVCWHQSGGEGLASPSPAAGCTALCAGWSAMGHHFNPANSLGAVCKREQSQEEGLRKKKGQCSSGLGSSRSAATERCCC